MSGDNNNKDESGENKGPPTHYKKLGAAAALLAGAAITAKSMGFSPNSGGLLRGTKSDTGTPLPPDRFSNVLQSNTVETMSADRNLQEQQGIQYVLKGGLPVTPPVVLRSGQEISFANVQAEAVLYLLVQTDRPAKECSFYVTVNSGSDSVTYNFDGNPKKLSPEQYVAEGGSDPNLIHHANGEFAVSTVNGKQTTIWVNDANPFMSSSNPSANFLVLAVAFDPASKDVSVFTPVMQGQILPTNFNQFTGQNINNIDTSNLAAVFDVYKELYGWLGTFSQGNVVPPNFDATKVPAISFGGKGIGKVYAAASAFLAPVLSEVAATKAPTHKPTTEPTTEKSYPKGPTKAPTKPS